MRGEQLPELGSGCLAALGDGQKAVLAAAVTVSAGDLAAVVDGIDGGVDATRDIHRGEGSVLIDEAVLPAAVVAKP